MRVRFVVISRRQVALTGRQQQQHGPTLLKLKGPQTEWRDELAGITRFTFDTGLHSLLQFDLIDKRGFMCFGTAQSCGAHRYPFRQVVESTPAHGRRLTQTLPLVDGGGGGGGGGNGGPGGGGGGSCGLSDGPSVAFTVCVDAPQRGPCILALQAGPFQTYTMPESVDQLWGPITLAKLPDGVQNTCIVASHR